MPAPIESIINELKLISNNPDDVDETLVDHLVAVVNECRNDACDFHEIIENLLGIELSETAFQRVSALMETVDDVEDKHDQENPPLLTINQKDRLKSLQNIELPVKEAGDKLASSNPVEKVNKIKSKVVVKSDKGSIKSEKVLPKELVGKDEFHTNRFERFHKTWMGKDQWKIQDHRIAETVEELDDDDYSSAWLECLRLGIPWGGRGAGGRGVMRVTGEPKDVNIPNVTMSRNGKLLLGETVLKLVFGKRYCLTGRNGCGKSTLLRRIARGALPGFPPWLQVQYVEQHVEGSSMTPVNYVVAYDFERTRLLKEEEELLERIEDNKLGASMRVQNQERLSEVYQRLDQISAWDAESRAEQALRQMGFDDKKLDMKTEQLSGGWRMRCCLCGTLFMKPDVLLLDEPTNSLDLVGVEFLKRYLNEKKYFDGTVLLVSHDRAFINHVSDELVVFRKTKLANFLGTYDEYREMLEIKRKGDAAKVTMLEKKKAHLQSYIDEQGRSAHDKKKKGGDQKKQSLVGSRKKQIAKIDRMGMGLGNGGGYFKQSKHGFYGEALGVDFDEAPIPLKFPQPLSPSSDSTLLLQLDDISYGYDTDTPLIKGFSAQVHGKCRIGIVGPNGVGKTTLLRVFNESVRPSQGSFRNFLPSSTSMAIFNQDTTNELPNDESASSFILSKPRGPGTVHCDTLVSARTYLGKFGLGGDLSTRHIETLSGGERSRVAMAALSYSLPELLILDEPTSHLDLESIDVLADTIKAFKGAAIIVSHDTAFLSETCNEVWMFDKKAKSIIVRKPACGQSSKDFIDDIWKHALKMYYVE